MDDFLEQVATRRRQGLYTLLYVFMWIVIVLSGLIALMNLMSVIGADENGIRFNFIALIFAVVFGGIAFLCWRRADYCRMEYDARWTSPRC